MKFTCTNSSCKKKGQSVVIRAAQLVPDDLNMEEYTENGTPFFYTIPPVFCGYCGCAAWQGEVPKEFQ